MFNYKITFILIGFIAPSTAPINMMVDQTNNPGELHVSWLPPLKETHNGVILGYHVKAVPQTSGIRGKYKNNKKYKNKCYMSIADFSRVYSIECLY